MFDLHVHFTLLAINLAAPPTFFNIFQPASLTSFLFCNFRFVFILVVGILLSPLDLHEKIKNNPSWRIEIGKAFQWGSGGWEAEACTPPEVLLKYFGGLCSMPRLIWLYLFLPPHLCKPFLLGF
jgi:hypothetical protein